ncbi:MAG: hypothetical protein ACI4CE_07485 [Methanomethylophilus alvi]
MCWTRCHNGRRLPNGKVDRRYECDRILTCDNRDKYGNIVRANRVLKSAMVGSTYYAAVESRTVMGGREVWAAIFLTCGRTKQDNTLWGYKDMSETDGPNEAKCPASVLALLTPTDSRVANGWRERCRRNIAAVAERRHNGPGSPFVPKGVEVHEHRGSWIVTSANFRRNSSYSAIRFTKARWREFDRAMRAFLEHYGTKEERAEFAAAGKICPSEWRSAAA